MEDSARLKNYYYFLISKRDYTRNELYKKAKLKKYAEEIIIPALDELEQSSLINDQKYAENYVYYKSQIKGRGWIEIKLRQKGIDKEIISNVFESLEVDTSSIIIKKVDEKFAKVDLEELEDKDKAKIYRYIMSQGFRINYGSLQTIIQDVIKKRSLRQVL